MPSTPPRQDGLGKWLEASRRVEGWIATGRVRPGQKLPTSGELCASLAVTAPTLRKAMARLLEAGLVEPLARGWRVAAPAHATTGLSVALVRACGPDGTSIGEADREGYFRHALELEGAKRGIRIEAWGISEEGELFHNGRPWDRDRTPAIHGVVLSLWRIPDPEAVFGRVRLWNLPLAIWDERPQGGARPSFRRVRWFQSAHAAATGGLVGRHLQELGHKGVAFLSPFHGSLWSRRRLEGLARCCAAAVPPVHLGIHTRDDRWDPSQYTPAADAVRPLVAGLASVGAHAAEPRFEAIVEKGQALLRDREILRSLDDLFERALSDRTLTAWVGANDDIALLACDWLSRRGLRVGHDISVVGFDNTARAQESGLTTVSFLEEDLAAGMLAYVLDPGRWRSNGSVVLEGSLVPRTSTGRPAAS